MYAIVRAGGKQLKVAPGDVVRIETPKEKVGKGETLTLTDVLFVGGVEGEEPKKGAGISVKATVVGPMRTKKVLVFKKKRRKQYRRTKGHRQTMLRVRIDEIG
ncbi:MAG TPA: 50S ribosomal protein L21 [Thermoanaerobaculia bacterium]|nr:50S ribosomal protein L21 [Thermoanaerobaculia bacterium]